MRVAVCLSGHMRTYERVAPLLLDHIVRPNAADVFISTWDGVGLRSSPDESPNGSPLDVDRVSEVYGEHLKRIRVFEFNKLQPIRPGLFYPAMNSMYWQVKQANTLRKEFEAETGAIYDVVVRARPDSLYPRAMKIDQWETSPLTIFVKWVNVYAMDDQFAMGSSFALDVYASLFDEIEHLVQIKLPVPPGEPGPWWPEQTLRHHLMSHGIEIVPVPIEHSLCKV